MKSLPIGISTLRHIIREDMTYIDKTSHAYAMIEKRGRYFLSRPRRFGKSLFVDTLKEIFEGNEDLFRGLYIHDKWDWSRKFLVIKIDFTAGFIQTIKDLKEKLEAILKFHEEKFGVTCENSGIVNRYGELVEKAAKKYGSEVVILVDEYDKPLLDNIENPKAAHIIRDALRGFYGFVKEQDANIRFVFLTGVSKFSKVNIFSGINNLKDITLDCRYATVCGYTQTDLETAFKEHLAGVDWEKLKEWYKGYNFLGDSVYNPFDILLFIDKGLTYRNYWFETGTPSFLIDLFKKNRYFLPDIDTIEAGEELLGAFDLNAIDPVTLLFQSGYLTIRETTAKFGSIAYRRRYPNREVKQSFNNYLIQGYTMLTADKDRYKAGGAE